MTVALTVLEGLPELIPSDVQNLVDEEDRVCIGGDGLGYLGKMQVHRVGVAEGQDQTRGLAFGRADRAEDVGRLGALIVSIGLRRWAHPF